MALPPIPNARIGDDPQRAQDASQQASRAGFAVLFRNCPILDGVLVGPVELRIKYDGEGGAVPLNTVFKHGLGRAVRGWWLVRALPGGVPFELWESDVVNKFPHSMLILSHRPTDPANANVRFKISLWIF